VVLVLVLSASLSVDRLARAKLRLGVRVPADTLEPSALSLVASLGEVIAKCQPARAGEQSRRALFSLCLS
jgi:tRNA A37 threonylcarbamoyladenosine synthetase subunit TsaC/SUA5/YrdC